MHHNKVLVVLTNTSTFPHEREREEPSFNATETRTGFNIKDVAYIYEILSKKNCSLIFTSPHGGECSIDPRSLETSKNDEVVKRFLNDHEAMHRIKNTRKLHDVADMQFIGAVFPGGPGTLFDLPYERTATDIVSDIYPRRYSFIAAIGHGLAALINVKLEKSGEHWLKGKRVTCQTVEEEKALKIDHRLPFNLEEKLKQLGAKVEKADKFSPKVVEDERLITAQNSDSVREWVETIARHCNPN